MLYAYRVVMVVGVGIYKVAIFPFCILYYWQSMYAFDSYPQSQTIMPKSLTCGYCICVPDTFVVGYHTVPTHY